MSQEKEIKTASNAAKEKQVKTAPKLALCFGRGKVSSQGNFDKYYVDYEVKQIAVKDGEGEQDFHIENKVIPHKRLIEEVVNAEASEVGVDAYVRRMALSGQAMPSIEVSDEVVDFTGLPTTTEEFTKVSTSAKEAFSKLPIELTQGMTYEQFIQSDTKALMDSYLKSLNKSEEKKEEVK